MQQSASFYFYGSLNDFLPPEKRNRQLHYSFQDKPALKDAMEALGVPHPEVAAILLNGQPAQLMDPLNTGDQLKVYPPGHHLQLTKEYRLRPEYVGPAKFIADVHLGKLVRSMRMLGFNCCYENNYSDPEIAAIAEKEARIVLTRDRGLLKHKSIVWGYWLRSQQPEEQLLEVVRHFTLEQELNPLSRCIACNGRIEPVPKAAVIDQLPPKTRQFFEEFFQCQSCRRVYWKGSHYERMQEFIRRVEGEFLQARKY
ncbi:Mut7-C RNAse domain-containing protein [Nafulsella turpanensis]|uniref:Mut7-C RNAse domain-containing protein n=1 Tax=Nafulsella turpanensis TaxID=1265690 RepID=UPI0003482C93|nr:Mut7-C RNAse domain-containing protein [Nafulsella turpanensis]